MRKLLGLLIALILVGPILAGLGIALFANPAATAVAAGLICPGTPLTGDGSAGEAPTVPETTRIVMPIPAGRYSITDSFGWRTDPFTGERRFHYGTDLGAADGTPILAAADGLVTIVNSGGGFGNLIVITHTVGGQAVATGYGHMWDDGVYVREGQRVSAGQLIGAVGSNGYSTGAHLHFEVHPGGWASSAVDGRAWLAANGAIPIEDAGLAAACLPTPTPTVPPDEEAG
jgi:murein DD-endopeptidase MepM/ murein hydrolase activator NlpD